MPSAHPNPLYSRAEIGILACSKCGNPMRLSQIEPAAPGYDVRTFECVKCNGTIRHLGNFGSICIRNGNVPLRIDRCSRRAGPARASEAKVSSYQ